MPCYDPRSARFNWDAVEEKVKAAVSFLTPKLCHACQILEQNDLLTEELKSWWEQHKKEDQQRSDREKQKAKWAQDLARRRAYLDSVRERLRTQLTPDEQEAVGLKTQT